MSLLLPGIAARKGNLKKSSKHTYPLAYLSFVLWFLAFLLKEQRLSQLVAANEGLDRTAVAE